MQSSVSKVKILLPEEDLCLATVEKEAPNVYVVTLNNSVYSSLEWKEFSKLVSDAIRRMEDGHDY